MSKIISDVQYLIVAREVAEFNFLVNNFHEGTIFDDKETRRKYLIEERNKLILVLNHRVPGVSTESILSNPEDKDKGEGEVDVDLLIMLLKNKEEKNDSNSTHR